MRTTRRSFIMHIAGIAAVAVVSRPVLAAPMLLDETDPSAQALGYTADATHVDRAKYPRFNEKQRCGNCQFYQGKPSDASAQCALFGAKQVSGNGWCNAYQSRA